MYLDLRHLGEKVIDSKLPFVRELCLQYERIDPVHELIPVRPVQHYMMGGVHTDIDGATGLPGLFAAGEVACVSINGANRLGSNSLPELLVFGRRAGIAAAELAATVRRRARSRRCGPRPPTSGGGSSATCWPAGTAGSGSPTSAPRCSTRWRAAPASTGTPSRSRRGADKLRELRERFGKATIEDDSRTFNTELVATLELGFMLDVAETMVACALRREESRGAHQRTDFPKPGRRAVPGPLAGLRATRPGAPRIEYLPVTITRWPPGERVYGR